MNPEHRELPTIEQIRSGETAALKRAAGGFLAALEAERVYAGILSADGLLRFKGSAPDGAGSPGPMEPSAVSGIAEAMATATPRDLDDARPPFNGSGRVVAIPWTANGEVFGVGIVVMPEGGQLPKDAVLALLGAKVGSTIATLRDCDALVHRVAELHDSADVLGQVIDASSDIIKITDLDGHLLRWNKACAALYGWPESDVVGEKMPHVPENLRLRVIHDIRSIAASGRAVHRQSAALTRDGVSISVDMTVIPFLDGEGNPAGVISVGREIKGPEVPRDEADMCGLLTDALSAPMASLVGYAQLLLHADILEDSVRRKRTVRAIEEHTATMSSLLEDMALISGAQGQELLDLERVDVSTLATDAVGHFERDRVGNDRFIIDYDSRVEPLTLDRRRMDRALQSVFSALLEDREDGTEVFITITPTDSGARIDIGTSAGAGRKSSLPGYGTLGLHIARVIVESHGGSLTMAERDSDPAFRIELPGASG